MDLTGGGALQLWPWSSLKHTGIHWSKNWGTQDPPPVRHPATSMHLSYRLASKSRKRRRGGHLLTSIHFILFFSTSLLRYSLLCPVWARYDMISIINNLLTISQAGKPSRISISPIAPPVKYYHWAIVSALLDSFIERRGRNKRMNSNKDKNDRKSK